MPSLKEKLHAAEFGKRLGKAEGMPMGKIFALAKEFTGMPPAEIEKLLESKHHAMRVGAVSIMDWKARAKSTTEAERKALFDLYIRRHDRIYTWDLVDRSAPYVVGGYLADKPRKILYKLARSANPHERRTAIVSTYFFIRHLPGGKADLKLLIKIHFMYTGFIGYIDPGFTGNISQRVIQCKTAQTKTALPELRCK